VVQGGNRTATGSFGRDVPDHQPAGSAAETAVGEKRHGIAKPRTNQRRSNGQHFAHAGPAAWTFIADDHHSPCLDMALLHSGECSFLVVENTSRAAEGVVVVTGYLNYAAFWGEIALKNDQPASRFEWVFRTADYFLFRGFFGRVRFLADGFSRDGQCFRLQQPRFDHAFGHQGGSAGCEKVGGNKAAGGFEVGDDRRSRADAVEIVNRKRQLSFSGYGKKMQDGIGGTTR